MLSFQLLNIDDALKKNIIEMGLSTPTDIQRQCIEPALAGHDILGISQTGSGKTAAFLIPVIANLMKNEKATALVLAPTRELASQIRDHARKLLGRINVVRMALLIGGEPHHKQMQQLKRFPRLIIGTPGRVNDHLNQKTLKLKFCQYFVLDEMDRMLETGFEEDVCAISEHFDKMSLQTLLFSATQAPRVSSMMSQMLKDPIKINLSGARPIHADIDMQHVFVKGGDKFPQLMQELNERIGSVIVFVKTKQSTEILANQLINKGLKAVAIHGDMPQSKRRRVLGDFRSSKFRVLVATDVAARGLDIDHVAHVINYDLPYVAADYIHRAGRTGRAGRAGSALCIMTKKDKKQWQIIHKAITQPALL